MKGEIMSEKNESRRKPSIKEIADRTGFSPATVSLVLNQKGSFSDETKHTIRQAYAELSHDRALAEGRLLIRVLIEQYASFETDPYYGEIIHGIEKECSLLGYEMVLSFVREGSDSQAWLNQVGGLIALGGGLITDELISELRHSGIPLVLVDNYTHKGDILSVQRIKDIHARLPNTHLVMHGSSSVPQELLAAIRQFGGDMKETYGVPVEELQEAIKFGVRKVNIDTDIRLAMTGAIRRFMAENPGKFDPREYLKPAREAAKKVCLARYEQFGTAGNASKIKAIPLSDMAARYASGELQQLVK